MNYKCIKCNKVFHQKSNYEVHISRKFSCNKTILSIKDAINSDNNIPHNSTQFHTNHTQIHTNSTQFHTNNIKIYDDNNDDNITTDTNLLDVNDKLNELICFYCNKDFSRKDALLRHQKIYCKNKKLIDDTNKTIIMLMEQNKQIINELKKSDEQNKQIIDEFKQQINELKEENQELKQLTICQVSKGKNSKKIANAIKNQSVTNTANIANIGNTNSITNANSVTNANTINNINNINNGLLVNFGCEDLSVIPENEILQVLKALTGVFTSFITTVHANEKYPEFSNLKVLNKRSNYGFMLEDGKFVTKTFNEITEELINTHVPELQQYAKDFRDQKKITAREYDIIIKTLNFLKNTYVETEDVEGNIVKGDKNDVKKLKQQHGQIINVIYDNRNIITKNIDLCENNKSKQMKQIMNI